MIAFSSTEEAHIPFLIIQLFCVFYLKISIGRQKYKIFCIECNKKRFILYVYTINVYNHYIYTLLLFVVKRQSFGFYDLVRLFAGKSLTLQPKPTRKDELLNKGL